MNSRTLLPISLIASGILLTLLGGVFVAFNYVVSLLRTAETTAVVELNVVPAQSARYTGV